MWYGLAAYGAWGMVPLYFKSIDCPPHEIVAHRILWSFVVLGLIITMLGRWREFLAVCRNRRLMVLLLVSGHLVAANWYVYVYSATSGQITQASLGYFLLPLVNAFVGVGVFREKIRPAQVAALALAAGGVLFLAIRLGQFPWIGITLAVTFSIYGVMRKLIPVDGIIGLTVETMLLSPGAVVFLLVRNSMIGLAFGKNGLAADALIACSGLVTTFPLVCFTQAIRRVPLVTIGFLQYLSPTIQLLVATLVYGEVFSNEHRVSFGLIWAGLLVFAWDMVRHTRSQPPVVPPAAQSESESTEETQQAAV